MLSHLHLDYLNTLSLLKVTRLLIAAIVRRKIEVPVIEVFIVLKNFFVLVCALILSMRSCSKYVIGLFANWTENASDVPQ